MFETNDPYTSPGTTSVIQERGVPDFGAASSPVQPPLPDPQPLELREVQMWQARVRKAKAKWEPDFARMRSDMQFAAGVQRGSQQTIDSEAYQCNIVLRAINQKVSILYAKNPKVEAKRRDRVDFQLYDEQLEHLMVYAQRAAMNPMDMEANAVLADYMNGMSMRQKAEQIGRTLEILYQWNMDAQEPSFKKQLKKLVRRVATCGVGYTKMTFQRTSTGDEPLNTSAFRSSLQDRAKRMAMIVQKLADGDLEEDSPQVADLQSLAASIGYSQHEGDEQLVDERLIVDFPRATSIIPDWRCTSIEDFEGGKWLAQEYLIPLDDVNAIFSTKIEKGGSLVQYGEDGGVVDIKRKEDPDQGIAPIVCLWEVFNSVTKMHSFIVDGWPRYVMPPEPVTPCTKRYWPIFALAFNSVEVEPGLKATIFPPSDVHQMRHAQNERNRSREELRQHRKANKPRWLYGAALLDEEDKNKLEEAEGHSWTETNAPAGTDLSKVAVAVPTVPIQPELYDTTFVDNDALVASGMQTSDLGPAQPNVTATDASIAAHARSTQSGSNTDDLDELLNDMAQSGGEMLLRECSPETVQRVTGSVHWVDDSNRLDYVQELYLEIQAGSSGRPNKALEMSNWQIIAPLLMQAGANPQFMVREGLRRLDDKIDPGEAFPLLPPEPPQGGPAAPGQQGPAPTATAQNEGQQPGAQPAPPKPPMGNPAPPQAMAA